MATENTSLLKIAKGRQDALSVHFYLPRALPPSQDYQVCLCFVCLLNLTTTSEKASFSNVDFIFYHFQNSSLASYCPFNIITYTFYHRLRDFLIPQSTVPKCLGLCQGPSFLLCVVFRGILEEGSAHNELNILHYKMKEMEGRLQKWKDASFTIR